LPHPTVEHESLPEVVPFDQTSCDVAVVLRHDRRGDRVIVGVVVDDERRVERPVPGEAAGRACGELESAGPRGTRLLACAVEPVLGRQQPIAGDLSTMSPLRHTGHVVI
jgi:hypothetical protein